jgi:hypothetical protein
MLVMHKHAVWWPGCSAVLGIATVRSVVDNRAPSRLICAGQRSATSGSDAIRVMVMAPWQVRELKLAGVQGADLTGGR